MEISINDSYRVLVDKYTYQLEGKELITKRDTKEKRLDWKFIGYYPNMPQVMNACVKHAILNGKEGEILEIEYWANKVKNLQEDFLKDSLESFSAYKRPVEAYND